jgi:hypothetical protein
VQIYDLETKYLDSSSAYGNAVRGELPSLAHAAPAPASLLLLLLMCRRAAAGYEGFLGGAGVANRKLVIKPEERLFSSSSATGQASAR